MALREARLEHNPDVQHTLQHDGDMTSTGVVTVCRSKVTGLSILITYMQSPSPVACCGRENNTSQAATHSSAVNTTPSAYFVKYSLNAQCALSISGQPTSSWRPLPVPPLAAAAAALLLASAAPSQGMLPAALTAGNMQVSNNRCS